MAQRLSPYIDRQEGRERDVNDLSPNPSTKRKRQERLPLSPLNKLPKLDSNLRNPFPNKTYVVKKETALSFSRPVSPETPTETDEVVEEAFGLDGDLKQLLAKCEILVLNPGQLTVGKGSFGTVIQATWRGRKVAVKMLGKFEGAKDPSKRQKMIDSEMNAKLVPHLNIVKILETYVKESHCYIVMEFVPSSLQSIIKDDPEILTPTFVYGALRHISNALQRCHEMELLHLDVKPGNILVTRNGDCKLADFGCSLNLNQMKQLLHVADKSKSKSFLIGTPGFMAPELIRSLPPTTKCDVFSFGILMWVILAKQFLPFPGLHMHAILFKVASQRSRPSDSLVVNISESLRELYHSCWAQDPKARPTVSSVIKSLASMKLNDFDTKSRKRQFSSTVKPLR